MSTTWCKRNRKQSLVLICPAFLKSLVTLLLYLKGIPVESFHLLDTMFFPCKVDVFGLTHDDLMIKNFLNTFVFLFLNFTTECNIPHRLLFPELGRQDVKMSFRVFQRKCEMQTYIQLSECLKQCLVKSSFQNFPKRLNTVSGELNKERDEILCRMLNLSR